MDITLLLCPLIFMMLIAAIVTIESSNLLSSIISLGALGFLLSIAYLFLGAPDIAILQIVVEIVVLVILIRATSNKDQTSVSNEREFIGLILAVIMVIGFSLVCLRMFADVPAFGIPVMDRIASAPSTFFLGDGLRQNESQNAVENIFMNFRAFDMLIVIAVLFTAVVGALALMRRKAHASDEKFDPAADCVGRDPNEAGMGLIVKTITRWIKGFLVLFGIYLTMYGSQSPGGGLTGGFIIACALILLTLAFGQRNESRNKLIASIVASAGALLFLGVGVVGLIRHGTLFGATAETTLHILTRENLSHISEIAIVMFVSSTLYLVFSILSTVHVQVRDGNRNLVRRTGEKP